MIGVGTCTPTLGNVVLGTDSRLMDLCHLTLAEYRASPAAVYPAEFGGFIPFAGQSQPVTTTPLVIPRPESPVLNAVGHSSGYSNISETAYKMQER